MYKTAVKATINQNSIVSKALVKKCSWSLYGSWILKTIVSLAEIGYLVKLLSNHSAILKSENHVIVSNSLQCCKILI